MIIFEFFYFLVIKAYGIGIFIFSFFNRKAKQWVSGRKNDYTLVKQSKNAGEKRIWFHCPSLGEFEQGRPVLEAIKKEYPDHKIVLTFFSPSGYEAKKNDPIADFIFYMPLDGPFNSLTFISKIKPEFAVFVKYDFWHFYVKGLKDKKIPSYFISCNFRPSQVYFKWYGIFFEKILRRITHLFVSNQSSLALLYKNSIPNVTVSGDTRFDRVYENSLNTKKLSVIEKFKDGKKIFIGGSTWPKDEDILATLINKGEQDLKWIIVPHEINTEKINLFEKKLQVSHILYSQIKEDTSLKDIKVLIIDNIGMLSSLYAYSDMAWIGGGFGAGIHNILEAAVFGLPVFIGPNYNKFQEAKDLVAKRGAFVVKNAQELSNLVQQLVSSSEEMSRIKSVNTNYIQENKGATAIIMNYFKMNH